MIRAKFTWHRDYGRTPEVVPLERMDTRAFKDLSQRNPENRGTVVESQVFVFTDKGIERHLRLLINWS
jgi:hypothetical protein